MFGFLIFVGFVVLLALVLRNQARVDDLSDEIRALKWLLAQPHEPPPEERDPSIIAESATAPGTNSVPPIIPSEPEPIPVIARTSEPFAIPPLVPEDDSAAKELNWERFLGAKLFAWVGGLALFLGVAFFLKYSFERNLITAQMRIVLGGIVGLSLVAGGFFLKRREYATTAQTLCGCGIVILYAVVFAAFGLYHFIAQPAAFGLMSVLTAGAFVLASRMQAQVVALLGMLGGFLTPILLSTRRDAPFALFSYIGLLDAGLIAIAFRRRWHYLIALAAFCTALMQFGWMTRFFMRDKIWIAFGIYSFFNVLFGAGLLAGVRLKQMNPSLSIASGGLSLLSLAVGLLLTGGRAVADVPLAFFLLLLIAEIVLAGWAFFHERNRGVPLIATTLAFLNVAAWTLHWVQEKGPFCTLAATVGFGLFHTAFPLLLRRFRPNHSALASLGFSPLLAIGVLLLLCVPAHGFSWWLWPILLTVNLAAFGLVLATGSTALLGGLLIGSLLVGLFALAELTAGRDRSIGVEMVWIAAAMGVLFASFSSFFASRARSETLKKPSWIPQMPALSAVLPYILLAQICVLFRMQDPTSLFSAALILTLVLLALSLRRSNSWTALISLAATGTLEYLWHLSDFRPSAAGAPFLWYVGFWALYTLFPFARVRTESKDQVQNWIASALSGPVHFFPIYSLVKQAWPIDYLGVLPALMAIPSFLIFWFHLKGKQIPLMAWFAGAGLFFITLIFPVQFEKEWLTLGWALEGMALLWLFRKIPHPGLLPAGFALLWIAFLRLSANPGLFRYYERSENLFFNWYLYTYGVTIAALLTGAWIVSKPPDRAFGFRMTPTLYALGAILAFILLNIEIANHFATGMYLAFEFSGSFGRDMTYSIGWALYALVLLVIGIKTNTVGTRYASVALLCVTLLKLFLHDLSQLDQLYRIGAFVGVAIVFLLAAFAYQKFLATQKR